jgi:enoyl-CoA hydratase/carnithine racemase
MSNEDLLYEQRGSVAWLTLNRPGAMNALNLSIIGHMEALIPQLAQDDSVRYRNWHKTTVCA